jgi:hypothetical protein
MLDPDVRTCLIVAGSILTAGGMAATVLLYIRSAPKVTCSDCAGSGQRCVSFFDQIHVECGGCRGRGWRRLGFRARR